MILDTSIGIIDRARSDLATASRSSAGEWNDDQREEFDSTHVDPILKAGGDLAAALRKAQDGHLNAHRAL